MIISLAGYMGSGKSRIAKLLSTQTGYKLIDLDREIAVRENATIAEIFQKKGELYFRRLERQMLEEILKEGNTAILSLGGGTPAYFDNIELIRNATKSFYLQASIPTLVNRLLKQKAKRPLIANVRDEDLPEFVAKHLFERLPYYTQCEFSITTDGKKPEVITNEIIQHLGLS